MASKAIDSTNNIDVRNFALILLPEINPPFTVLLPSIAPASLGNMQIPILQSLL